MRVGHGSLAVVAPLSLTLGSLTLGASAQDWPSFRGPGAQGIADGQNLPADWDVKTGRGVRWTAAIPGVGQSSPIVWGDRVFVTTAVPAEAPTIVLGDTGGIDLAADKPPISWRLLCLDARDGKQLWEGPFLAWRSEPGGPYTTTPLAYRDLVYAVRDEGVLGVHDLRTGALVYRERTGTTHSASPVASDGKVYLAGEDGQLLVLRAGRAFEVLARIDMGETVFATPAISRGTMYVRTRGHVYAISATGQAAASR